jgi:hypothetical protein
MRIDRSLLNWGVFLIALGGVPLAVQRDWADAGIAGDLLQLWPLILVGVGLGLILRWTPVAWLGGALVAGTIGLMLGALVAGGMQGISTACVGLGSDDSVTTSDSGQASGTSFELQVNLSCGDLTVTRAAGAEWALRAEYGPDEPPTIVAADTSLTIGQPDSGGLFAFSRQTRNDWQVSLPLEAALSVGMTLNAANGTVDVGAGSLERIQGTVNAGVLDLDLSSATTEQVAHLSLAFNFASGSLALPDAAMTGALELNVSALDLCVPADAEARFELESTLSSDDFSGSGLTQVGDSWQTSGFDTATERIDVSITSTVSSISVQRPEVCP